MAFAAAPRLPHQVLQEGSSIALAGGRIDEIDGRVQVGFQHVLCTFDVSRQYAVGKRLMAADKLCTAVNSAHHHAAVAIGLVVEVRMRAEHPPRAASREEGGV